MHIFETSVTLYRFQITMLYKLVVRQVMYWL